MNFEPRANNNGSTGRRARSGRFGFTLLELLIATAIFATVLVAINTVFSSAIKLRRSTTEAVDRIIPVTRAVAIMKKDLRSIVPPAPGTNVLFLGEFYGGQQTPLEGLDVRDLQQGAVFLDFYSFGGTTDDRSMYADPNNSELIELRPWADVQRIDYYLRDPLFSTNQGSELVRTVRRNLLASEDSPEIPVEEAILDGVRELNFGYFDGTNWLSEWNSTNAVAPLPKAIMVSIEFDYRNDSERYLKPPLEFVVPILTQSLTNQFGATNATTTAAAAAGTADATGGAAAGGAGVAGGGGQ